MCISTATTSQRRRMAYFPPKYHRLPSKSEGSCPSVGASIILASETSCAVENSGPRTEVHRPDWRFHSGLSLHLPESVGIEAGVRRVRPRGRSSQCVALRPALSSFVDNDDFLFQSDSKGKRMPDRSVRTAAGSHSAVPPLGCLTVCTARLPV